MTIAVPAVAAAFAMLAMAPAGSPRDHPQFASADLGQTFEQAVTAGRKAIAYAWALGSAAHERAPALVMGLGVASAIPAIALLGLALRRRQPPLTGGDCEIMLTRAVTEGLAWPADAFLHIDGATGPPRSIGRELLRIGREDDNDLCLEHPTVHRYHAVVRRTPESDFIVVDLSAREGNGVLVNGTRVAQVRLRDGDVIGLGQMRLKFATKPA